MKDGSLSLAEKALAENYDFTTTTDRRMQQNECCDHEGLSKGSELVMRVKGRKVENYDTEEDIELMEAELKEARKTRKIESEKTGDEKKKCKNCNLVHIEGEECSAKGKTHYKCEGQDNYARSPACPQSKPKGKEESTARKVTEMSSDSDTDNNN